MDKNLFNYNECAVCLDEKFLYKTSCNHYFCIGCIVKISKCPLCRSNFILPRLHNDLNKYFINLNEKKLNEIKNLFDILPNYVDLDVNINISNIRATIFVDYIYLSSEERRLFSQNAYEYIIN